MLNQLLGFSQLICTEQHSLLFCCINSKTALMKVFGRKAGDTNEEFEDLS